MKTKFWHKFIKPSTIELARHAKKTRHYSLFDFIHGYVYGRWPYLYIGIGTGEHPLSKIVQPIANIISKILPVSKKAEKEEIYSLPAHLRPATFADTYHGKVVTLSAAKELINIHEEIRLTDLEQIIPYTRARDIIMKNPDHIVVLDCPCRTSRKNPCLPLDVCLIVGEPFAGFVVEHHPKRARWITPVEAEQILEAEHQRGHVQHAFFKDAMLGRFYAICNCCSCCCGAIQAQRNGTPMLTSSGYVARIDEERCIVCGNCWEFCQFGALALNELTTHVDEGLCMGCGVCVDICEQEAISLVVDPEKGEPLIITNLIQTNMQDI